MVDISTSQWGIDTVLRELYDGKPYLELPATFNVRTPISGYNPDWAVVMEDRDQHGERTGKPLLYLVGETKDTTNLYELRPAEPRKVICGDKHFRKLAVGYKVVTCASGLREDIR